MMGIRRLASLAALTAVVTLSACDSTSTPTEPLGVQPFNAQIQVQDLVCDTITFDDQDPALGHGSLPITQVTSDFGDVNISVVPNTGTRPVAAIYSGLNDDGPDFDLEGVGAGMLCPDCAAQKNMLVMLQNYVSQPGLTDAHMFDVEGDSENGGTIVMTMADGTGMYFYEGSALVDDDHPEPSFEVLVDDALVHAATPLGNGTVEHVGDGTPYEITTSLKFVLSGSGAVDDIAICKEPDTPPGDEGCTPGYWKQEHHFGNWPETTDPYTTTFGGVFGCSDVQAQKPESGDICAMTLLTVLELKGGGNNALARHAAAAYLNAASSVMYPYDVAGVIKLLNSFDKDALEEANESYCPLGRSELDD
jgi:hypothetical protein